MDVSKHMDKIEGRVVQRHDVDMRGKLALFAPPLPGGPAGTENDEDVIDADFEELLDAEEQAES